MRTQGSVICVLGGHYDDKPDDAGVTVLPGDSTDEEIAAALVSNWSIEDPDYEWETDGVDLTDLDSVRDLLWNSGIWTYVEKPRMVEVSM